MPDTGGLRNADVPVSLSEEPPEKCTKVRGLLWPIQLKLTNLLTIPRPGGNVQIPVGGVAEPGMLLYGPEGRRMLYGRTYD